MTSPETYVQPTYRTAREALAEKMRYVQDFPEQGVLFEDLTPVLADGAALKVVIAEMAAASTPAASYSAPPSPMRWAWAFWPSARKGSCPRR